jgi:hypothetical protein
MAENPIGVELSNSSRIIIVVVTGIVLALVYRCGGKNNYWCLISLTRSFLRSLSWLSCLVCFSCVIH